MSDKATLKDFKVRDLPGIWGLTFEQEWMVENLIPSQTVTMLSGESGCGKSTFTLALADAVSKGEPFLGYKTTKTPTLIIDRENGLSIYHERLQRFNVQPNPDLMFWGNWNQPVPPSPEAECLAKFVQEEKPLIIFDSFVSFHPGNEQDATETRLYMDKFRKLAAMGATIILIHHTGKGLNTKIYRGSSDIKASVDVLYVMNTKKPRLKLIELKPDKVREGTLDPISLAVEDDKWVLLDHSFIDQESPDWKAVIEVVAKNPGLNQLQIVDKLDSMPQSRVRKILNVAEGMGYVVINKGAKNASLYTLGQPKKAQEKKF